MRKLVDILSFFIVILFFLSVFNYYSSNKNIKKINSNRSNFDNVIKNKISNLPILSDDTKDVIIFNSSFSDEIKDNEPRSFWNLLKKIK
jgi:YbbR domain-containing protein